ncbi:von Willebrand factor, type A [Plesiocystis pacifica SIR-1]|uniref:von Willebrand factor, type A n=2 Tax=Plesiocystis pacifica TaxID=191768 RepID=A6G2V8_9BACT|nr:von Willebrand factor, type A [Plesiocystis pacifica SIR-1]
MFCACTPYGAEMADTDAPELDEEFDEALIPAMEGEVEPIYGEDEDRFEPVETHEEDLRCWKDGGPRQEAWEVADPNADPETGAMHVMQGGKLLALPLQGTSFDTVVVGTIAETEVVQTFANPFDEPIEAVYLFPLHEDAAVDDYALTLGERTIRGEMKTREDAQQTYEDAKKAGKAAGLLEQERPNIFTQRVANIPPGQTIEVSMHVVQPLEQEDGRYELVLPTVVGPRFIPGTPLAQHRQPAPGENTGIAPNTDEVPDASRITAPVVPEGFTTCAHVEASVVIDTGLRPRRIQSKFHGIDIMRSGDVAAIELDADSDGAPVVANRDFVVSWDLGRDQPKAAIVAQPPTSEGGDGYFTLTVQPPEQVADEQAVARELVFVVDNSGSMGGLPMDTAKGLMRKALKDIRPDDTFTVLRFSESASGLSNKLLPATQDNIEAGVDYVDAMQGMGGTQMTEGIKAALRVPHDPDRLRVVMFLTDGYIGNEQAIFELIDDNIGDARLFSLGVGGAPNRYLLDGMASVGRGAVTYAGYDEPADPVIERFYERVATPVLTDVEIDWQGLAVEEVYPGKIPDLFAGQPITVFGRYAGAPTGEIVIKAKARTAEGVETIELPVHFDVAKADDVEGVGSVWARTKIDALMGYPMRPDPWSPLGKETKQAVIDVALQHRIMTEYTAFVAVDERVVAGADGSPKTVVQPLELPEGSFQGSEVGEAYGVGGLGLVGTGRGGGGTGQGTIGLGNTGLIGKGGGGGTGSGYGRGSGAGFGGQGKRVPKVRQAKAQVKGSLDRDIIRRIVRAHINEVRSCYNATLTKDPNASGSIAIKFMIDAHGKVMVAKVQSNDTGYADLGTCIAKKVERWKFPKPKGSTVEVVYPFKLSPG